MNRFFKYYLGLMVTLLFAACGPENDNGSTGGGNNSPSPQSYTQSVTLPASGGEQVFTLSDLRSPVSDVDSTPSWLEISPQYYSTGSPTIKLKYEENIELETRDCVITVLASSGDKVILTVTQHAAEVKRGIENIHNTQTNQQAY